MRRVTGCLLICILFFSMMTPFVDASAARQEIQGASEWAAQDLERADQYGLLPDRIKTNMKAPITREEFAELAVLVYEKYFLPVPSANVQDIRFSDTKNIYVRKAAYLGIVSAADAKTKKYMPAQKITGEQIAALYVKLAAALRPTEDFSVAAFSQQGYMKNDAGVIGAKAIVTREQAALIALRIFERYVKAEQSGNELLPAGFPAFVPVTSDAALVDYVKQSEEGSLDILLSTSQSVQALWDFYGNMKNYGQFEKFNAFFDEKTGQFSVALSLTGLMKMDILICQDINGQNYAAVSIRTSKGKEGYIEGLDDKQPDLQSIDQQNSFYDFVYSEENRTIEGMDITTGRTKPNRTGYKGKVLPEFPGDVPLAANANNMRVSEKRRLGQTDYIRYVYDLKIPEGQSLKFFLDYHNYSNLSGFDYTFENHWGLKSLKVYSTSDSGMVILVYYYYDYGRPGKAVVSHSTDENKLFLTD